MIQFKKFAPALVLALTVAGAPLVMAEAQQPPQAQAMKHADKADPLERHIEHLHHMLKVTAAQDAEWAPVAQTIRDNEMTMEALIKQKNATVDSQNAVEDLTAYSEIAEAHAVGTKKLADVFGTFYSGLSDAQKKVADDFFRAHKRMGAGHMAMNDHPSAPPADQH